MQSSEKGDTSEKEEFYSGEESEGEADKELERFKKSGTPGEFLEYKEEKEREKRGKEIRKRRGKESFKILKQSKFTENWWRTNNKRKERSPDKEEEGQKRIKEEDRREGNSGKTEEKEGEGSMEELIRKNTEELRLSRISREETNKLLEKLRNDIEGIKERVDEMEKREKKREEGEKKWREEVKEIINRLAKVEEEEKKVEEERGMEIDGAKIGHKEQREMGGRKTRKNGKS